MRGEDATGAQLAPVENLTTRQGLAESGDRMPGWKGSNRREELPPNWPSIRIRILARDGHRCVHRDIYGHRCTEVATDVDHIRPGNDHSDANLRSLCSWHHDRKSAREGAQAVAAARKYHARKFRREEPHPGALRPAQGGV